MPWVCFEYVEICHGKDYAENSARVFVEGAQEAEEFADRLRAYGSQPHKCLDVGDKGVLIVNWVPICYGNVWEASVFVIADPPKDQAKFNDDSRGLLEGEI